MRLSSLWFSCFAAAAGKSMSRLNPRARPAENQMACPPPHNTVRSLRKASARRNFPTRSTGNVRKQVDWSPDMCS